MDRGDEGVRLGLGAGRHGGERCFEEGERLSLFAAVDVDTRAHEIDARRVIRGRLRQGQVGEGLVIALDPSSQVGAPNEKRRVARRDLEAPREVGDLAFDPRVGPRHFG